MRGDVVGVLRIRGRSLITPRYMALCGFSCGVGWEVLTGVLTGGCFSLANDGSDFESGFSIFAIVASPLTARLPLLSSIHIRQVPSGLLFPHTFIISFTYRGARFL